MTTVTHTVRLILSLTGWLMRSMNLSELPPSDLINQVIFYNKVYIVIYKYASKLTLNFFIAQIKELALTRARESYLSDPVLLDKVRERLGSQKFNQKLVRIRSVFRKGAS